MTTLVVLCGLSLFAQEDAGKLVEQLRSEQAETRRAAKRKLQDLGKAARPALEKAAADRDPEVSATAKELLQILSVSERLTTALKATMPGVEGRLATGKDAVWTEVFVEAVRDHPSLAREDLEPLAPAALRGAEGRMQKHDVMAQIAVRQLKGAAPAMVRLLADEDENVPEMAAFFLGYLGSQDAVPGLREALRSPSSGTARRAVRALGQLRAAAAVPDLVRMLEDSNADLRKEAAKALTKIGPKDAAASIGPLLQDPKVEVRVVAASCLCGLGAVDGVPTIFKDVADPKLTGEEGPALTFLNALRHPEAWRKLASASLAWDLVGSWGLEGSRGKILDRIASGAGLKMDVLPDAEWARGDENIQKWCGPTTLPEDLMMLLSGSGYDAIVESDRLRIVPHAEALAFWRAWWTERQQKK
jgi:HEAT repeat protein